jgi:hypothetical protein
MNVREANRVRAITGLRIIVTGGIVQTTFCPADAEPSAASLSRTWA